ncbi:uncharacterized protein [Maniola hyperantus]|uniref:uncharacterized protein n=1 Tax=Aphantopus hyperantus TaxID=2795564 RepID=UPI00374A1F9A
MIANYWQGAEVRVEVPVGGGEDSDSFVTIPMTQPERPCSTKLSQLPTVEQMFAQDDCKRALQKVVLPPALTRVCPCAGLPRPVLPQHSEPYCLQFRDLPIRTVRSRTLVLRNVSRVDARWRAAVRRWPRAHARTIDTEQWAGDVHASGAVLQCAPRGGVLGARGRAALVVSAYADCWGLYRDQLLIQVHPQLYTLRSSVPSANITVCIADLRTDVVLGPGSCRARHEHVPRRPRHRRVPAERAREHTVEGRVNPQHQFRVRRGGHRPGAVPRSRPRRAEHRWFLSSGASAAACACGGECGAPRAAAAAAPARAAARAAAALLAAPHCWARLVPAAAAAAAAAAAPSCAPATAAGVVLRAARRALRAGPARPRHTAVCVYVCRSPAAGAAGAGRRRRCSCCGCAKLRARHSCRRRAASCASRSARWTCPTTTHCGLCLCMPVPCGRRGWCRPPPPLQLLRLRQAARPPQLQASCCELRVALCALDLPDHDTLRRGWCRPPPPLQLLRLRQAARPPQLQASCCELRVALCALGAQEVPHTELGEGALEAGATTEAPWRVEVSRNVCDAHCVRLDRSHQFEELKLKLAPRSSIELFAEVSLKTEDMWPPPGAAYPPQLVTTTALSFYDDDNVLLLSLPLTLELEQPVLRAEPTALDFGVVSDGSTRKACFTVSHSSLLTLELVTQWNGDQQFRLYPPALSLRACGRARVYVQYTAR